MTFSRRMGLMPEKAIQTNGMDQELRNGIWNAFISSFARPYTLAGAIWGKFFKKPSDELPSYKVIFGWPDEIRDRFFACSWYEVYDFLEFVVNNASFPNDLLVSVFINTCNVVLKRENAGYRFLGTRIVPVTSEHEIAAIEAALAATAASTPLNLVNTHLKQALALLSGRVAHDYRNSMKESIRAVECLCKLITKDEKGTLGKMLTAIEASGKIKLHKALADGFKQLYNYTSDSDGIRHALKDEPTVDVEDARYMLVMCAGFVSYLVEKTTKASIAL